MRIPLGLRAAAGNVGGPVGPSNPWDIGYASFTGTPQNWFEIGSQELLPSSISFKSDGSKMYVMGTISDSIHEYNLSTAWLVGTASYVQSFDVSSQETTPNGLFFKSDGTAFYIVGGINDTIYQYSLSTAWDISTASYVQGFSVSAQDVNPTGIFFKPDGAKMYVIGAAGDDVNEYSLSTAWDISTASYVRVFSVSSQSTNPQDLFFKDDGTKMYIVEIANNRVYQYSLSTAWNISTASYTGANLAGLGDPRGMFFKADGTSLYVTDASYDVVNKFDLGTAWDLSTADFTYPTIDYFNVSTQDANPTDIFFKGDGTKMYMSGLNSDSVHEYSLSTAWDVHTASYVQAFSVAGQEVSPTGLFFKPDGAEMYIVGTVNDTVYQYTLSTEWDVSSASYTRSFSVSGQEGAPEALAFKDDGTKMYVMGSAGDDVNEYSLSTAWDISTASFVQTFSVGAQDTLPNGLFFKDDGTKMYVVGQANDSVYEYSLSTAWDVSTASYTQTNNLIPTMIRTPEGVFFKPDGGKMFIIGSTRDAVWAFTIS